MKRKRLLFAAIVLIAGALGFNSYAQEAGTYYIQNVGTGKWLGPGNNWSTQASVLNHADYWKLAKISDGVFTLESVVSNGGTSYYLNGTYCDGGATNFTFTAIAGKENTYSIANASGGYLTTNGTTVDVSATNGSAEASQWKLWSEKDMSDGMAAATVDNPFDATYLIKDHDLGRNNRDYSAWSNTNATAPKTSDNPESGASRYSIEAYCKKFDVNQTISGVPNGVYAVKVNGFYRKDNNNDNIFPFLYANDRQTTLPERTGSENSMQAAAVSFEAGNYLSDPVYVQITNGTLKVGVKTEGTSCWSIFKNFHLSYYGDVTLAEVLLAEYVKAYNEALAEAQGYQNVDMFDADKAALNTAITNNTVDLSSATEESLVTATANLKAAAAAAAKAQTNYAAYQNIANAVNGHTNVDITSYFANLGFEEGNLNAWTTNNGGNVATNNNFSGKVGSYFVERWQNGVALGSGSLTHDAITLPAGLYSITTNAQNIEQYNSNAAGTGYFFCVNEVQKEIGAAGTYTVVVKYDEPTEVTLKFLLNECTGNWVSCDNIIVTYVGEDFPEIALVEGKMNADVNAAQTAAKAAYDTNRSAETYTAILDAVAAAQTSVDAYKKLGDVITKIDAALDAATSATESADAYQAIKTAYNDGSIADADIPANVIPAYEAVIPVIKSQTAASADFTLAIQNQSFEYGDMTGWTATASSDTGVRETANATYAAEGTDGSYLFNTWWQGVPLTQTVAGLPNGEYTLTASVSSDGATIYLLGNGEHNDGIETGGTYPSSDTMQEATLTFLVKNGTATIGVVGGADGTAGEHKNYVEEGYWWYKADNFRLMKNRDLTEEELAVVPTAIALYNGETEVTETIALDATANTVTLTPVFTPENATKTVTWTSSDETVATVVDGVVTGIAPGSATITVTSTLDANVSATAEVTVSYPESTVPETTYVNDGPTRTICTLGENIIMNGSFEYPNPVYGWTTGSGSKNAMVVSNFNIPTTGAADGNQYLQAKESKGGSDAKSINTSWAIEEGKTYVFGYKIKANKQCTTDLQYIGVSLSNTKGSENSGKKFDTPAYGTEWTDVTYTFTNSDNYKFLVFNARWMANAQSFDNFYLCEATTTTEGNVDYAKDAIPTSNVGTGAFQYSQDAIDAANALVQGEATVEDVENAYEALTTLNAPAEDKLYNIINITEGFNHNGKALTFKSASDADLTGNTTTMGWTEEPGSIYPQGVTFTAVEGVKNGYTMSYTRADGNVIYASTGITSGLGNNTAQIRPTTDASKALTFVVISTDDNKWNLMNTEDGHSVGSNGDTGFYTAGGSNKDVKIQEAVNNEVTLTAPTAKYGTMILPFDAEAPENVTIYSVWAINGSSITLEEESSFVANTPYIVYYGAEMEATVAGIGSAYTDENYSTSYLTGVYKQISIGAGTDGKNNYVLQTNQSTGKQAFYIVGENAIIIPANRAYLTNSSSNGVKTLNLGDDPTSINALDALTSGAYEGIYTVDGVKLNRMEKGVNILKMADGTTRKVVVK